MNIIKCHMNIITVTMNYSLTTFHFHFYYNQWVWDPELSPGPTFRINTAAAAK